MQARNILNNTDSMIVLLVGAFHNSKIVKVFHQNFINIIEAHCPEDACQLLSNNTVDIVLCDHKSIPNPCTVVNHARKLDDNILCILSSFELHTYNLLMSIDLKIDAYLNENDETDKHCIQLDSLITKYLSKKNIYYFGDEFNENYHDIIVSKTNTKGYITYVNEAFCEATGYSQNELLGQNHNIIRHEQNQACLFKELWHTIKEEKTTWKGIIKNINKDGFAFYAKSVITPILDKYGNVQEYLGQRINISKHFCDKSKLFYNINNHDLSILALIQIDNVDIFEELYTASEFKNIEQKFGQMLLEHMTKEDLFNQVYYLGQGRYALQCDFYQFLKQNINIKEYFENYVYTINQLPFELDYVCENIDITLSFAYGKENLYEDAHYGLRHAIKKQLRIFDSNDIYIKEHHHKKENKNIIKTIKKALDDSRVISYFQPIINNKTLNIDKYESLVRLIDEQNNILEPHQFLNVAKRSHFYHKITQNVLINSFNTLCKVNQEVTINLCMSDIEKKETMDIFFELLEHHEHHAHRLVIELLEDEHVTNYNMIKVFITGIKQKGVKVAIDDFGSGYSNFERLMTLQPDIIKIDGSLVKNIEKDSLSRNLVETISFLSKKQNIKTVAEYVENENIYNILNDIGIDYSQGFFFGKPEKLACS